jgi:hypothetical protein
VTRGRLFAGMGALATALLGATPLRAAEPLVVIVSDKVQVDDVSAALLHRVFTGEPTEADGAGRFVPLNLPPGSPARVAFDQAILDLSPDEMSQYWVNQRIRGKGPAPRSIPDPRLAVQLVLKLPGAIAYVPASLVTAGVKVLSVDGKKPGEPGYPLP